MPSPPLHVWEVSPPPLPLPQVVRGERALLLGGCSPLLFFLASWWGCPLPGRCDPLHPVAARRGRGALLSGGSPLLPSLVAARIKHALSFRGVLAPLPLDGLAQGAQAACPVLRSWFPSRWCLLSPWCPQGHPCSPGSLQRLDWLPAPPAPVSRTRIMRTRCAKTWRHQRHRNACACLP